MLETTPKMVRYDIWCHKCQFKAVKENNEPCEECLSNPINLNTEKPINFKG